MDRPCRRPVLIDAVVDGRVCVRLRRVVWVVGDIGRRLALVSHSICYEHSALLARMYHHKPLPRANLCRVPACAKCQTLGKEALCRVPDFWHSAKHMTLGKVPVSCSALSSFFGGRTSNPFVIATNLPKQNTGSLIPCPPCPQISRVFTLVATFTIPSSYFKRCLLIINKVKERHYMIPAHDSSFFQLKQEMTSNSIYSCRAHVPPTHPLELQ